MALCCLVDKIQLLREMLSKPFMTQPHPAPHPPPQAPLLLLVPSILLSRPQNSHLPHTQLSFPVSHLCFCTSPAWWCSPLGTPGVLRHLVPAKMAPLQCIPTPCRGLIYATHTASSVSVSLPGCDLQEGRERKLTPSMEVSFHQALHGLSHVFYLSF